MASPKVYFLRLDYIRDFVAIPFRNELRIPYTPTAENAAADLKSRIHNVAIWFRTHFAEKIDIDEISSANGFSHDHFFKCWKRYFALTPVQFINNLRLEAAAQRLIETNISVSEIIKEVHFAGEYMFYKRFRQKYAMTPAEYRRSHTLEDLE